ncbi:MAG: glycosyltransferase family 4 protein [Candidatus Zixiibacteriota bacterium]
MPDRYHLLLLVDSFPVPEAPAGLLSDRLPWRLDPELFATELAVVHDSPPLTATAVPALPVHTLGLRHGAWTPAVIQRLAVRRLLRRLQPDYLCTVGASARLLGLPAAHALDIPLRLSLIDNLGEDLTPASLTALRMAGRHATRFVVDSYAAARRLMRQERVDRARIDIIPPGVDYSRFPHRTVESVIEAKHALGLSRQQPLVVMAISSGQHQDCVRFVHVAAQLIRHQPDARFVLIGTMSREHITATKREIQTRHLSERLQLIDSPESLPLWLQAADVGVSTSHLESASRPLLLYMATGLPIVAVDAGGNRELITHGESGYLCDLADLDQLAMYIMVFLLSPEQSARIGATARHRAETEFPLSRATGAYEDYFRTLAYAVLSR